MATVTADLDLQYRLLDRPPRRRNNSDELDVFDAASYFSGEERCRLAASTQAGQVSQKDASQDLLYGGSRKSVDLTHLPYQIPKQKVDKKGRETKPKTPNSTGSRLANFLNSLFNSTPGKKKSKPNSGLEEIPCGGRRRRSSISHLQSVSDNTARSLYSYPAAPDFEPALSVNTKIYKEINGCAATPRTVTLFPPIGVLDEKRYMNIAWLEQKLIFSDTYLETANAEKATDVYLWKEKNSANGGEVVNPVTRKSRTFERDDKVGDAETTTEIRKKKNRKSRDERLDENDSRKTEDQTEDGFESDSDLFELQNYDLTN